MGIPHTCYSFIPWVVSFTPPSIEHQVERNNSILRLFGRCMLFVCEIEIVKSSLHVLSPLTISVSHTNSMLHHTNDTDSMLHVHFIVSSTYVQLDYIYIVRLGCGNLQWNMLCLPPIKDCTPVRINVTPHLDNCSNKTRCVSTTHLTNLLQIRLENPLILVQILVQWFAWFGKNLHTVSKFMSHMVDNHNKKMFRWFFIKLGTKNVSEIGCSDVTDPACTGLVVFQYIWRALQINFRQDITYGVSVIADMKHNLFLEIRYRCVSRRLISSANYTTVWGM